MNKVGWVLRAVNVESFYNGTSGTWSYIEVDTSDQIDSQYIYESEQCIKDLPDYPKGLRYRFEIVNLNDILLKPKCPYTRHKDPPVVIRKGANNELCTICAINILADEEYVIWNDNKAYCLHCIMKQLYNIDELLGSTPSEWKMEWKKYGKVELKKCLGAI